MQTKDYILIGFQLIPWVVAAFAFYGKRQKKDFAQEQLERDVLELKEDFKHGYSENIKDITEKFSTTIDTVTTAFQGALDKAIKLSYSNDESLRRLHDRIDEVKDDYVSLETCKEIRKANGHK